MGKPKEYVMGFIFDESIENVVMIQKNRPAHLAGIFNGIGGKVDEEDGLPLISMIRETREECGLDITEWNYIGNITQYTGVHDKNGWTIHFYWCVSSEAANAKTMEDEKVMLLPLSQTMYLDNPINSHVWWMLTQSFNSAMGESRDGTNPSKV